MILALVALAALGACDGPPVPTAKSPRVVVLSPAAAIILRDLGHEPRMVGRHAHDLVLDRGLPICGDQMVIDLEAIIDAAPTVVITQWGVREVPPPLAALARERGFALHEAALLNLDDIEREITALDRVVVPAGTPAAATLLHRFQQAMSPRGPDHGRFPRVGRVLLLAGVDPPGALGPTSCHSQLLARIGATLAISEGAAWIEMDTEDLVRLDPDAVILVLPRSPDRANSTFRAPVMGDDAVKRLGRLAESTRAARTGRVALIDDPRALTPSTAMIDLADAFANVLTRWELEDPVK